MSTTGANIFLCGILVVDAYLQYMINQMPRISLYIFHLSEQNNLNIKKNGKHYEKYVVK